MKKLHVLLILITAMLISPLTISAETLYFFDNSIVFPGHEKTAGLPNKDVNGVPDLTGGSISSTSGALTQVTLDYIKNKGGGAYESIWNSILAADIFFNTDGDDSWDYIIHNPYYDGIASTVWDVYKTDLPIYSDNWKDYYYTSRSPIGSPRKNHPISLKPSAAQALIGTALYDGWRNELNTYEEGTSSWNLSYFGPDFIPFDDISAIAFSLECANDNIFETSFHTPEPGTLLLTALGSGMVWLHRRRRK
jgi:hypothetical protein